MVLCAYLGQLAKVRDALSDTVAVVIDERDQADLADHEEDRGSGDDTLVEHVKVSKRVRGTISFRLLLNVPFRSVSELSIITRVKKPR